MKTCYLTCLLAIATAYCEAFGSILSTTNNGIYIAVYGIGQRVGIESHDPFQYDDTLIWQPFSNVGARRIPIGNPKYSFRLTMLSPNGEETSRTQLGTQYGSRFDQMAIDPSDRSGRGMGSMEVGIIYYPGIDDFSGQTFPSPKDLFEMDQVGMYTMELEFQVFGPHKDAKQPGLEILRFPPMRIKLEKPITAPFFLLSATNQGVHLAISGTKAKGSAGFDDGLLWRAYCENQHSVLHSLDLSTGFKMKLLGPDSKEVTKTALGQTIGGNFEAVKTMDRLPSGTILSDLDFRSGLADIVPAKPLPRLRDCFAMDRPGIYTLELQMQLFRITYKTAGEPEPEELLRFPPMTIKVNRP